VLEAYFEGTLPDNDTIKRLIRNVTFSHLLCYMALCCVQVPAACFEGAAQQQSWFV
jgi:hypothetical protein